jgi:hypothetical protein
MDYLNSCYETPSKRDYSPESLITPRGLEAAAFSFVAAKWRFKAICPTKVVKNLEKIA